MSAWRPIIPCLFYSNPLSRTVNKTTAKWNVFLLGCFFSPNLLESHMEYKDWIWSTNNIATSFQRTFKMNLCRKQRPTNTDFNKTYSHWSLGQEILRIVCLSKINLGIEFYWPNKDSLLWSAPFVSSCFSLWHPYFMHRWYMGIWACWMSQFSLIKSYPSPNEV